MIHILIFGASGDLAQRKTFPALISLIKHNALSPSSIKILGFARTSYTPTEFKAKFNLSKHFADPSTIAQIEASISYHQGAYDSAVSFKSLQTLLNESFDPQQDQLICYLALPPSLFLPVSSLIQQTLPSNWIPKLKLVIEKPFGTDTLSSAQLSHSLGLLFEEEQIYRIDHYLGKEMVKNIVTLRFFNHFFSAIWNNNHIASVQITFKETLGLESRAGYFDSAGILRDVFQNHLLQILSIVAMEPPLDLTPESIQNEKVRLLKSVRDSALSPESAVFAQYRGYLEEPGVAASSRTCTFATILLQIDNERWSGVPFVCKCGKALDESKAEIRIQLKDTPASLRYCTAAAKGRNELQADHHPPVRNELVIRVQPNEAIYLKLTLKKPGCSGLETEIAELDLSYASRFQSVRIPDAYECLILDIVNGDRSSFVRSDELEEAWRITDPLIALSQSREPLLYGKGTRGPVESDALVSSLGNYLRSSKEYHWPKL